MAFLLNILWFVLGGGWAAGLLWLLTGCLLMITVVGIPFGWAAFRIAGFAAFPFGKELVDARELGEERLAGTGLANILWIVLAGIWLAISHVLAGVSLCVTIIGIPFGFAHFRLASVCFAPLGKRTVDK
ncbi:MAG: YccF domain-containing protein [Desulfobacter sp.]|nr:MAG: YccF domain-containing protein [Desulfobacter sp.]